MPHQRRPATGEGGTGTTSKAAAASACRHIRASTTDATVPRQLAVLALGGLDTELGLAVPDVMKALNYRRPNAHTVLDRLTDLGYLERIPDEQPTRWRKPQADD